MIWDKILKTGHVTPTTPIRGWCVIPRLVLDIFYLHTKFGDCCFRRSRDMVGAHQNVNGSCDLTTPFSGMICHLWHRTCYDQPAYLSPLT